MADDNLSKKYHNANDLDGDTLTPDQKTALQEILFAYGHGDRHLLTGYAGTGKTTLMWHLTRAILGERKSIVLTAPTHKAVAVLARKLRENGLGQIDCMTIHKLLELKAKVNKDRLIFTRDNRANPVVVDVVVIDECSMLDEAMMTHIRRHLPMAYVVFVGDPAQIPPVGEVASISFDTKSKSNLTKIMRQSAENPILQAAHIIRQSQGGPLDLSWCKRISTPPIGVFVPNNPGAWMKKAFTSEAFDKDPDTFRYLCWTNACVEHVNKQIRRWRYGDNVKTPFVVGEMALFRAPIIRDKTILFSTNEEAMVKAIEKTVYVHSFPASIDAGKWAAEVPVWAIKMETTDGIETTIYAPSSNAEYNKTINRIKDEAALTHDRWGHLHDFKGALAQLQSIYAMTVHTSQGSTFANAFVDVADIKRRASSNLMECQQLFYVAATRPSTALILVGV